MMIIEAQRYPEKQGEEADPPEIKKRLCGII